MQERRTGPAVGCYVPPVLFRLLPSDSSSVGFERRSTRTSAHWWERPGSLWLHNQNSDCAHIRLGFHLTANAYTLNSQEG